MVKNYYKTLQVDPEADIEVIQSANRRLAEKYHSDVNDPSSENYEKMILLNEAYAVLSNAKKRAEYDRLINLRESKHSSSSYRGGFSEQEKRKPGEDREPPKKEYYKTRTPPPPSSKPEYETVRKSKKYSTSFSSVLFVIFVGAICLSGYFINLNSESKEFNASTKKPIYQYDDVNKFIYISRPPEAGLYNQHYYLIFEEHYNWNDAEIACQKMDGHLASITSMEENQFIWILVRDIPLPNYSTVWIGGNDENDESNWEWVTGEPFNLSELVIENGGRTENYLNLRANSGFWEDFPVTGELVGNQLFVCEWEE